MEPNNIEKEKNALVKIHEGLMELGLDARESRQKITDILESEEFSIFYDDGRERSTVSEDVWNFHLKLGRT